MPFLQMLPFNLYILIISKKNSSLKRGQAIFSKKENCANPLLSKVKT